jgi:FtsP/CotA-like multicopper oxidase with cupredoxin domain
MQGERIFLARLSSNPYFGSGFKEGFMRRLIGWTAAFMASSVLPQRHAAIEPIAVNDNRAPAGVLDAGVLTIRLEARVGEWHPDRDDEPGLVVRAFAETGKRLQVPGPLIRVAEGTEIHAFVSNTLARGDLVVHGLSRRGVRSDADTINIAPGATREVRFLAGAPGTYYYWGTIDGAPTGDQSTRDAELSGAFVVDPRAPVQAAPDRVFLIGLWSRVPSPNGVINRTDLVRFTINGKAWPNTEHLSYTVGDTARFRIINTTIVPHPMHLHGFYFNVDSRGNGTVDTVYDRAAPPYRVVTERAAPGRTFSMTWIPERAGNWMFHCHDNYHVLRNRPLDGAPIPAEHLMHVTNHAREMMGGLVMGIEVRDRAGPEIVAQGSPRRALRLVARVDSGAGGTEVEPAYGYVLEEGGKSSSMASPLLPGPTIVVKRGQPVSLTVVNQLPERTSVHWHGIELESYFDGVADFAGAGRRIASAIAPGDSFEARFTPPRSGTFIYHPHADEVRQQQAGLAGALLVVDDPKQFDPRHDVVLLLSVPRREVDRDTVLVNGSKAPPPLELRVGERYRLRIVDIHTFRPSMIVSLLRDSSLTTWRALAKDGMDLPPARATSRPARQQMGNGETYDFELVPEAPGDLRFMINAAAGPLLASMIVRVR